MRVFLVNRRLLPSKVKGNVLYAEELILKNNLDPKREGQLHISGGVVVCNPRHTGIEHEGKERIAGTISTRDFNRIAHQLYVSAAESTLYATLASRSESLPIRKTNNPIRIDSFCTIPTEML